MPKPITKERLQLLKQERKLMNDKKRARREAREAVEREERKKKRILRYREMHKDAQREYNRRYYKKTHPSSPLQPLKKEKDKQETILQSLYQRREELLQQQPNNQQLLAINQFNINITLKKLKGIEEEIKQLEI